MVLKWLDDGGQGFGRGDQLDGLTEEDRQEIPFPFIFVAFPSSLFCFFFIIFMFFFFFFFFKDRIYI